MINNNTYQVHNDDETTFVPKITSSPTRVFAQAQKLESTSSLFSGAKWKHVEKCRGIQRRQLSNLPPLIDQTQIACEASSFSEFKASNSVLSSLGEYHQRFMSHTNNYDDEISELNQFSFVSATCVKRENKFSRSSNMQRLQFEAGNNFRKFIHHLPWI